MPRITPDQHRESICTELEETAKQLIRATYDLRLGCDHGVNLLRPAARLIREQHAEIERLRAAYERGE